jgi:prevent-host-death family protein
MEQVPVRSLRNRTADVLTRVKHGEVLEITEYGRPVARIVPLTLDRWEQMRALDQLESAVEPGDPLDIEPVQPASGVPLPSQLLARLRVDER